MVTIFKTAFNYTFTIMICPYYLLALTVFVASQSRQM